MIALVAPLAIGPRLEPCVALGDGSRVYVSPFSADGHRLTFTWTIDGPDGKQLGTGQDLSVAVFSDVSDATRSAMGSMLSFLAACAESRAYGGGEIADLFSEQVGVWAEANSDELGMLSFEIEGE